ncbi:NRDE family protein [Aestuariibacter sp. AA17]|uniref:NRDE family protein n=1 Tax=Fluctibacter corallii TaxID=2984329 RepID=A0ABT3A9R7_9ALTE|nr:NRDE family protein [Aestuariibacter sp. AA17]MCV2885373.1 NRDE family protein [Aestuariibacter sp. AA17]
MCILFLAIEQHPDYPLIVAANRDEFYARPTEPSQFWRAQPELLAGKDREAGGTWMGMSKTGKFSALTNFRDPRLVKSNMTSRGYLTLDYLTKPNKDDDYLELLKQTRGEYNGYNLLFGNWRNLQVYNNITNEAVHLSAGVHSISNGDIHSQWPKMQSGINDLKRACMSSTPLNHTSLFNLLKNGQVASDTHLPDTGVPFELEKALSSIFIQLENYGTRSSTLLTIDKNETVLWLERTFDKNGQCALQKNVSFSLK